MQEIKTVKDYNEHFAPMFGYASCLLERIDANHGEESVWTKKRLAALGWSEGMRSFILDALYAYRDHVLSELKAAHGDLIDRDALGLEIERCDTEDAVAIKERTNGRNQIIRQILSAPVVVPAKRQHVKENGKCQWRGSGEEVCDTDWCYLFSQVAECDKCKAKAPTSPTSFQEANPL